MKDVLEIKSIRILLIGIKAAVIILPPLLVVLVTLN